MIRPERKTAAALEDALRAQGVRVTRQRSVILAALAAATDRPEASELHRRVAAVDPGVSLATVYRTLAVLERQGVVRRHGSDRQATAAETTPGARLTDVDSGAVVEIRDARIGRLLAEIAAEHGFRIVHHRVEIRGRRA